MIQLDNIIGKVQIFALCHDILKEDVKNRKFICEKYGIEHFKVLLQMQPLKHQIRQLLCIIALHPCYRNIQSLIYIDPQVIQRFLIISPCKLLIKFLDQFLLRLPLILPLFINFLRLLCSFYFMLLFLALAMLRML